MMKKKKKGAIALYSLFIIIALLVLSGIMVNVMQGMQMATRMNQAAEEGAKVRAQAIDILLKEQAGIIEVYHESMGYTDTVEHSKHADVSGHESPELPNSANYQKARKTADDYARDAVLDYVNSAIKKEVKGKNQIVNVTANDICFDIQPLPDGSLYEEFDPTTAPKAELEKTYKMDFSCTTPNGDTVKAYDVKVSGVKKNTVKVGEKNGKIQTVKVANVVFTGIKFEYTYYISDLMKNFDAATTSEGEVWAIAYPQTDKCVRTDEKCEY